MLSFRYRLASGIYERGSEVNSTGGLPLFFTDTPGFVCLKTPLSSLLITSLALRKISSFPSQMSLCYLFAGSLPTEKLDLNFFVFFYIPILRLYFPIKSQSKHIFSLRKDRHTILPKSFLEYLLLLSVYLEEDAEDRLQGLQNLP